MGDSTDVGAPPAPESTVVDASQSGHQSNASGTWSSPGGISDGETLLSVVYAFQAKHRVGMADSNPEEHCGIGIRGVAIGIDSFVWIALLFVSILVAGVFTGQVETSARGLNTDLEGGSASMALGLWLVLALGYHTVMEWQFGKTIGKALVNIRVTSTGGAGLTLGTASIRNVLRLVDWFPGLYLVGVVGIAVSDRQQRLGDRLAGTTVVSA
ncbi:MULTISPECIES: RDD family protein [Haloferax]|uniref:RDD family protein n=1 Tax=Haloferax TaxID=2251 RepID=UPI000E244852|nr:MULTISPECIES: RDD family protein [Haloferax]MBC9987494.1 RDD family protein [Haloferax sp. AS1]RDZ31820.1 RDD family protein [Haloferax sp. Atlit-48N]RDZ36189.1 RDD family protein [Haloferax sp. Atlit-47N]WEL30958.1 putative membrane protein YckC, RDD family [Haloferax alexandrinus]